MFIPLSEEEENEAGEAEIVPPASEDDDEDEDEEPETASAEQPAFSGKLRKKTPRKLPKYMQRPEPTEREGFVYENFRVFVKWTLEFIANNAGITSLGAPEAVYVNMPREFSFLYDMVNEEEEENGIRFAPLAEEQNELVLKNLELYGGFFAKQMNKFNSFHFTQLDSIKTKVSEKASSKAKNEKKPRASVWETIKKIATTEIGGKK